MKPATGRLPRYLLVAAILLLGAYLRWRQIGAEPLGTDDSVVSLLAFKVARRGEVVWLGQMSSVGVWQSPFNVYLYALPYLIAPDPRLARFFTGAMNVLAIALTHAVGARYFGWGAGVIAIVLYAVHPEALVAGRGIWIQRLGAPFVMLYVLTALLGYYEGKRWARILHLPMLSLAVQCHPAAVLIAPISVVQFVYALGHYSAQRRGILMESALSTALAAVTMVPWGVGLVQAYRDHTLHTIAADFGNRGLGYTLETTIRMLGGWRTDYVRPIQPTLTAIGAVWLAARAWRNSRRLPGLVVVMAYFLVPVLALALDLKYRDYYLWPHFPNAFVIQGAVVGGLTVATPGQVKTFKFLNRRGLMSVGALRWPAAALVTVIVAKQLSYLNSPGIVFPFSLDDHIAAIGAAARLAQQTARELLILVPSGDVDTTYLKWETLNEPYGFRVIWGGRGLPLPNEGAILLGPADYAERPLLFSGGRIVHNAFRIAELPPAARFSPDLLPMRPVRFSNGATVLGFLREKPGSLPMAGQPWTIHMLWRIERPQAEEYGLGVQLVNEQGDLFGQVDRSGLPVGQQQAGEHVLSQFDFHFGEGLPATGPLFLRFGMRGEGGDAQVLDSTGQPTGGYGVIQIRGQTQPQAVWENGVSLDHLAMNSPLLQGPPLEIWATWYAGKDVPGDLRLRWRLLSSAGVPQYDHLTDLLSGSRVETFLAGVFVSEYYHLRIPTDIPAGNYSLEISLANASGEKAGDPFVTEVEILNRVRSFDPPDTMYAIGARFGDAITLLGHDLEETGNHLQLVLHWQAIGQIEKDYKYFVHVWRDGQVVAQSDGMPDDYAYPTSWWAPDEVFSETIRLDLTTLGAGTYALTTGFYNPNNGLRLPVVLADGSRAANDWVDLQTIDFK